MAQLPNPITAVAEEIPEGYGMAPMYQAIDFGRKGTSFLLCEGTPNLAFDERIRRAVSAYAVRSLGFNNFKSLHVAHGYSFRANGVSDFTPAQYAGMQAALGQRYWVRAESKNVMLISVAEWYTPSDIHVAFGRLRHYGMEYGRVVKGDMCTVVNGLRLGRYADHTTDETLGSLILDMEQTLARPNVKVSVNIEFVRTGKHAVDIYQMTIRGEWQGGGRIKPDFMGA